MAHPYWPLFDLEIRTPRMTLRYLDDDTAVELAELAGRGVHDPATMPFSIPWTDQPSPDLERNALRYWWRCRAETTPQRWAINLVVRVDGAVVGASGLSADDFGVLRSFETGSWLGLAHQRAGLGRELRAATLHLGFAGFGALMATTAAFDDNPASLGVTTRLGYETTGTRRVVRRDAPATIREFRMSRDHWETIRRDDITLHSVDAAIDFLEIPAF